MDGKVGRQLSRCGDPALAYPGALADPFIRGVEAPGEFVVRNDSLGQVGAASGDLGSRSHLPSD
jgi:hypothetical protein